MRYAIFSDVHANPTALGRLVSDARRLGVERWLCLGDVVGYGPQPVEALALVRALDATVLAGNHDDAVSGRGSAESFVDLAAEAVARHRAALSETDRSFLGRLPYRAHFASAVAVHGDFTDPRGFNYVDDEASAAANFAAEDAPLAFVGHTHVPCIFLTGSSGRVYRLPPQDFLIEPGKRYLVNPGSVGYPREADGVCRSSYVIYDTADSSVRFRFLPFAVSSVMQRGRAPHRVRIGLLLVIAAAAFGSALWTLSVRKSRQPSGSRDAPETRTAVEAIVVTQTVRVVAQPHPKSLVEKTLRLNVGDAFVRANVRLERESAPVQLRIAFLNATGACIAVEMMTVRAASRQRFATPAGAHTVNLSLISLPETEQPTILEFAPRMEGRPKQRRRKRKELFQDEPLCRPEG